MIQLNLLPKVKVEYLKAQRMRRLAISLSIIVSAAAIVLLVLLLGAEAYQKHTLNNLDNKVSAETTTFQNEPHINNVLTVQNQLKSINSLHASEPAATRLVDYLNELVPTTVNITDLTIDFNADTLTLSGGANTISNINQFVDTLKFTDYNTGKGTPNSLAFNDVVLASFGEDSQQDTPGSLPASYSVTANFNPIIFNATENVALIVPSIITTRSSLENPGPLFVQGASHGGSSSSSSSSGGQ